MIRQILVSILILLSLSGCNTDYASYLPSGIPVYYKAYESGTLSSCNVAIYRTKILFSRRVVRTHGKALDELLDEKSNHYNAENQHDSRYISWRDTPVMKFYAERSFDLATYALSCLENEKLLYDIFQFYIQIGEGSGGFFTYSETKQDESLLVFIPEGFVLVAVR